MLCGLRLWHNVRSVGKLAATVDAGDHGEPCHRTDQLVWSGFLPYLDISEFVSTSTRVAAITRGRGPESSFASQQSRHICRILIS